MVVIVVIPVFHRVYFRVIVAESDAAGMGAIVTNTLKPKIPVYQYHMDSILMP